MNTTLKCHWHAKDIGTIRGFLSEQECDDYIQFSEKQGFDDAPITTSRGMVMMKDVRNNDRVMVDDEKMAEDLWLRIKAFVPARFLKKWQPVGLNERLRFYRYSEGQQFDWHMDGYFERENGEQSFFTFLVYLNDDFGGGHTSFREDGFHQHAFGLLNIRPEKGTALIFHHPVSHRGDPVIIGTKYVLRTDVMFERI